MAELYVYADAQAEAASVLRTAFAGRSEAYAQGIEVGGRVPRGAQPQTPYLLVAVDGSTEVIYPIVQRSTVRVTVWHIDPDAALDLAQLAQAVLLAVSTDTLTCHPLLGPQRAYDPDTETDLAWFTVRATCPASRVPA